MKPTDVIDLHCDVLMKLSQHPEWSFSNQPELDVNAQKLAVGQTKVQAMAIFIDPEIPSDKQYEAALAEVKAYQEQVLTTPGVVQLKKLSDIESLQEGELGTFLTLEGVDCIGNDLAKLDALLDAGVLSVGLTWNSVNLACDGLGEPRGGGLTAFGKAVVNRLNERKILVDVAHISVQGFWDVISLADHVIASHANVRKICDHRRNLTDHQIKALIARDGVMHCVYLPTFVKAEGPVTLDDLLEHFAALNALGVMDHVGLGSDFDGISSKIVGLEDSRKTKDLLAALTQIYGSQTAAKIANGNFRAYVKRHGL